MTSICPRCNRDYDVSRPMEDESVCCPHCGQNPATYDKRADFAARPDDPTGENVTARAKAAGSPPNPTAKF